MNIRLGAASLRCFDLLKQLSRTYHGITSPPAWHIGYCSISLKHFVGFDDYLIDIADLSASIFTLHGSSVLLYLFNANWPLSTANFTFFCFLLSLGTSSPRLKFISPISNGHATFISSVHYCRWLFYGHYISPLTFSHSGLRPSAPSAFHLKDMSAQNYFARLFAAETAF